jgi:hypothetical protein
MAHNIEPASENLLVAADNAETMPCDWQTGWHPEDETA